MERKQRTRQEWAGILREQEESGQNIPEWCESHGVNAGTLRNQIMKRRRLEAAKNNEVKTQDEREKQKGNGFMEVTTIMKELSAVEGMDQEDTGIGRLYIEIGNLRLAANTAYPVGQLAELCKGLMRG
jgi:hypothetical protein